MSRILVVDDEHWICAILEDFLEEVGYDVDTVADIASARDRLAGSNLPNLVILDARLPDGSGRTYAKELRDTPETHNIPILLLSADDPKLSSEPKSTADDFLLKPFDLKVLRQRIENLLEKKSAG